MDKARFPVDTAFGVTLQLLLAVSSSGFSGVKFPGWNLRELSWFTDVFCPGLGIQTLAGPCSEVCVVEETGASGRAGLLAECGAGRGRVMLHRDDI